ncbi:MAG TPA: SDR family oxidoreductase [Rectinema sp.]|nr:SDR family oxidoreductase [Rectinema sp.]
MQYNPFTLLDKTILITGASSGIGKAAAIECSKMGAKVIITARNVERLEQTIKQMAGSDHEYIKADLSKSEDIKKLISNLPEIDGLVNNAGISKPTLTQFISEEVVNDIFLVNTFAPIYLTQGLLKQKRIKNKGSIVFTSSISGLACSEVGESLYSASKAAINGFVKGAAIELATKGIRLNTVNPGLIDTNIFDEGIITKEQLEEKKKKYPLRRFGKPEEVAYAIIYFLSDASLWTTGANLIIDGGYTLI